MQLRDQVRTRDSAIQRLETRVDQAESAADKAHQEAAAAMAQTPSSADEISGLQHDVADLKTLSTKSAEALQNTETAGFRPREPAGYPLQRHHPYARGLPGRGHGLAFARNV